MQIDETKAFTDNSIKIFLDVLFEVFELTHESEIIATVTEDIENSKVLRRCFGFAPPNLEYAQEIIKNMDAANKALPVDKKTFKCGLPITVIDGIINISYLNEDEIYSLYRLLRFTKSKI